MPKGSDSGGVGYKPSFTEVDFYYFHRDYQQKNTSSFPWDCSQISESRELLHETGDISRHILSRKVKSRVWVRLYPSLSGGSHDRGEFGSRASSRPQVL